MNANDNTSNPQGANGQANGQAGGGDDLVSNVKSVVSEAENLLRSSGDQMGANYQAALERFESTLQTARMNLRVLEEQVAATTKEAMATTDRYVQENPWAAVGIGAVAGLLIGMVLGRNR